MNMILRRLAAGIALTLTVLILPRVAPAAVPMAESGLKSFEDWQPDKTGTVAVSAKLQEAIDWCRLHQRTLYLPPGTYLLDRTIELRASSSNSNRGRFPYIHGDAYNRPVIRLKDGTFSGTPAPEAAMPVFRLRHENHPDRRSAWIFFAVLSNLRFDLGDNSGACALNYASAQDSHLVNIGITGSSFTAGIVGLPGRNAGNINLEVVGGRFGIVLHDAVGINLTGIRLVDQSDAAVKINHMGGSTIVGLEVLGPGPAVVVAPGNDARQGLVYLLDARIELTDSLRPAFQLNNRALVLRHVYVKGTATLVAGESHTLAAPGANVWNHVRTYAHAPSPYDGKRAFTVLDGVNRENQALVDLEQVDAPPNTLRTRHLPDEVFAFNHPAAVNALKFPGDSIRSRIQAALDGPDRVIFIPGGRHELEGPLTVPVGKALIGDPGKLTFLIPTYTPKQHTFVIETADTEGRVTLQDLFVGNRNLAFDGGVHWRTSDGFMLNLRGFVDATNTEVNARTFQFSGHAGGKFYGLAHHRNISNDTQPESDEHRKVLLIGTTRPITFYGLNVERGGEKRDVTQPAPFAELVQCHNVRILGAKTEPDMGPVFTFRGGRNLSLVGLTTHRETGFPFVRLLPEPDLPQAVELALVGSKANARTTPMIEPYSNLREQDLIILLRAGFFNHAAFGPGALLAAP